MVGGARRRLLSSLFLLYLILLPLDLPPDLPDELLIAAVSARLSFAAAETARVPVSLGPSEFAIDKNAASVDLSAVAAAHRVVSPALIRKLDKGVASALARLVLDDADVDDVAKNFKLPAQPLLIRGVADAPDEDRAVRVSNDVAVPMGLP